MTLTPNSSFDFEVEVEIPLNDAASSDTTHRVFATTEVTGEDLTVPVILDSNTVILLDHTKVADTPWGVALDADFVGSDAQKTFAKTAQGWEITATFDAQTGVIGGTLNQTTLTMKLNQNAILYDLTITGAGSIDKAYRSQAQNGVTISFVAYRVTHPAV